MVPDYDFEFQRAWKNQVWHLYEPTSFDLAEGSSIVEKANRSLGRLVTLSESSEHFKIHMLLGQPQDERLLPAFGNAQNILNKIPVDKALIREDEAAQFARELAKDLAQHR